MMKYTVFYAWQSDRPNEANRYLIRDALDKAIKAVAADATIEDAPSLDSDTQSVPGIPAIADTILQKIDRCGIFVADLTFVGSTEDAQPFKLLPNPNVLIELGYALATVGDTRIICVMNTAYGPASELVFDLAHRRWPIQYEFTDLNEEARQAVLKTLTHDLERAIRTIINSGVLANLQQESPPTLWLRNIVEIVVNLLVLCDEFADRIRGGQLEDMRHLYESCAHSLRDCALRNPEDDDVLEWAKDLARNADGLASEIRDMSMASGPQLKETNGEVRAEATELLATLLDRLDLPDAWMEHAKSELIFELRKLKDIVERSPTYRSRSAEFQQLVSATAHTSLRRSYYPLSFVDAKKLEALRDAYRSLHLIDTTRLSMDGGASYEAMISRLKRDVSLVEQILESM